MNVILLFKANAELTDALRAGLPNAVSDLARAESFSIVPLNPKTESLMSHWFVAHPLSGVANTLDTKALEAFDAKLKTVTGVVVTEFATPRFFN